MKLNNESLTLIKDVFVTGVVKLDPFFAALSARPTNLVASRRPSRDRAKFLTLSRSSLIDFFPRFSGSKAATELLPTVKFVKKMKMMLDVEDA